MLDITKDNWSEVSSSASTQFIFVHTPFCATCQLAEKMLSILEQADQTQAFFRMNASFFPEFMQDNKVESVPALLKVESGVVLDRLYAFESVTKLHDILAEWKKQSISQ
ncbi:thioredoxin family protein [Gracilibacillus sp. S3-1-1]|uniref:Thioredoxin family protein n=1 Tax=Gracilibacillus pellucidus TaxID=3095368 RepID=A0ACC6M1A0_9BACI|nr:thioredoxin family protein [Gracilibacillus sp. S3-1-1]MDX8044721.1 thioredoxin family protein [Gracilibacillus sp. S3-1-1]